MSKLLILGGTALAAAIALPLIAAEVPMTMGSMTRADVSAKVKEMFAKVDTSNDGIVTREEADAARTAMHGKIRGRMREHRFEQLDTNKDGSISRAEFDAAHRPGMDKEHGEGERHGREGQEMGHHKMGGHGMGGMKMFDRADADADGKVTLAEATTAALAHFDAVDKNKDGTITRDERHAYHEAMHAQKPAG
jgi:Ca2+-binding EF-hand superfamily protein